ncbi:unnamed protein product, partial [Musa hybrid cultivar]
LYDAGQVGKVARAVKGGVGDVTRRDELADSVGGGGALLQGRCLRRLQVLLPRHPPAGLVPRLRRVLEHKPNLALVPATHLHLHLEPAVVHHPLHHHLVPSGYVSDTSLHGSDNFSHLASIIEISLLGLPVGKHIFLCATIDGKLCMRPYTPTSPVDEIGHFELLINV